MRRDDGRFDWDVPLGRRWARLLVVAWLLPLILPLPGMETTIWPWTGWGQASAIDIGLGLMPLLLGVAAWWILGLERRRLRGALLVLACAASTLVPFGRMVALGGDVTPLAELLLRFGWQPLALALGAALIVAGNRQQKQSLGEGIAPFLAASGGLLVLGAFLVPTGLTRTSQGPIVFLLERQVWTELWPLAAWTVGLLAFAVLGALSPISARVGDPLQAFVEGGISRLARLLPVTLPILLVGLYVAHGLPRLDLFFLLLAKVLLHVYAVVMLIAIGFARVLDDADPEAWVVPDATPPELDSRAAPASEPA